MGRPRRPLTADQRSDLELGKRVDHGRNIASLVAESRSLAEEITTAYNSHYKERDWGVLTLMVSMYLACIDGGGDPKFVSDAEWGIKKAIGKMAKVEGCDRRVTVKLTESVDVDAVADHKIGETHFCDEIDNPKTRYVKDYHDRNWLKKYIPLNAPLSPFGRSLIIRIAVVGNALWKGKFDTDVTTLFGARANYKSPSSSGRGISPKKLVTGLNYADMDRIGASNKTFLSVEVTRGREALVFQAPYILRTAMSSVWQIYSDINLKMREEREQVSLFEAEHFPRTPLSPEQQKKVDVIMEEWTRDTWINSPEKAIAALAQSKRGVGGRKEAQQMALKFLKYCELQAGLGGRIEYPQICFCRGPDRNGRLECENVRVFVGRPDNLKKDPENGKRSGRGFPQRPWRCKSCLKVAATSRRKSQLHDGPIVPQ